MSSVKGQKYNLDNNGLNGYEGLAVAIVLQAGKDWYRLCEGFEETADCNFIELECFFNGCAPYLSMTGYSANRILKNLLQDRAKSNYIEKREARRSRRKKRKREFF